MTSTMAQCRDPGVRNEIANTTLAAFFIRGREGRPRGSQGSLGKSTQCVGRFSRWEEKSKKKKKEKSFKKDNDPRNNIDTINKRLPSCNCRLEVR